MGKSRYDAEQKATLHARIIALSRKGWTQSAIATDVGLAESNVSSILRYHGICYRRGGTVVDPVPPPLRRIVIDMAEVFDAVVLPKLDAYARGEASP